MPPDASDATRPTDGWIRHPSEQDWRDAVFSFDEDRPDRLLMHPKGDVRPTVLDLNAVTGMDELTAAISGYDRLELSIDGTPAYQVIWPPGFTPTVLAALRATLTGSALEPAEDGSPEPEAEAIDEETAVPDAESDDTESDDTDEAGEADAVPERRSAVAGMIGALALVGAGALITGAILLSQDDPKPKPHPSPTTVVVKDRSTTTEPRRRTSTTTADTTETSAPTTTAG